jgi:membrane protease YdiL (CAAX protease family)
MTQEPTRAEGEYPTPGVAAALTVLAGLVRGLLLALLVSSWGVRPGFLGISSIIALGLAFAFAAPRLPTPEGTSLGLRRAPRAAWLAVPFLIPALLLVSELDNVAQHWLPAPEASPDSPAVPKPDGALGVLEWGLVLVLVLPFTEEIFFRGLLQPGLVLRWGTRRGVAAAAGLHAAFGLLALGHLRAALFSAGLALVLGILRQTSGSVVPGLVLHCSFGAVSLLAQLGWFGIPGFDDSSAAHTPLGWLAPAAFLCGIGFGLCRAAARLREARAATDPPAP